MEFSQLVFCLVVSTVLILSRTTSAFVCTSSGIFADTDDCTGFYICDTNLQEARGSCSLLGTFSSDKQACVVGTCLDLSEEPVVTTTSTTTVTSSVKSSKDGTLTTNIQTIMTTITTLTTNSTVTTKTAVTSAANSTTSESTGTTTVATTTPLTESTTESTTQSTTAPTTPTTQSTTQSTTTQSTTTVPSTTTVACTSAGQTFPDPSNCRKYYQCDSNLKLVSQSCWLTLFQYYDSTSKSCVFGSC